MVLNAGTRTGPLDGNYYQAPFPLETGIVGTPRPVARQAGGKGEIDDRTAFCAASASCQRPFRIRIRPLPGGQPQRPSVRFCARNRLPAARFLHGSTTMEEARATSIRRKPQAGRRFEFGERQNMVRWLHVAKSTEDYDRKLEPYDLDIYENFYSPFFPQRPADVDWVQNIKDSGLFQGGTLEQPRAQFTHAFTKCPREYLTLIWHYAQEPKDEVIKELDEFMRHIWPSIQAVEPAQAKAA